MMSKQFSAGGFRGAENSPVRMDTRIDSDLLAAFPENFVREHGAIPVYRKNGKVIVAVAPGAAPEVLDYVKFRYGSSADFVPVSSDTVQNLIEKNYGAGDESGVFSKDSIRGVIEEVARVSSGAYALRADADFSISSPVVRLAGSIIEEAFSKRASDVHLEPYEEGLRVRYRIDGVLYVFHRLPIEIAPILTSRIKVMCELDIAEKRRAQQGQMNFRTSRGDDFECRVSVVPVTFGEKIAIRILDKGPLNFSLKQLGFEDSQLADFEKAVRAENGMVLIAGPTGSGKTTTLYSVLEEIKSEQINIVTAEDPIEYNLSGINQVQIRENIGLTFSECLRNFLRQDPDVILVGEIRDSKTADIAVKASLTGHLMFSTIHTSDALSSVVRLLDMGIEPFLVASSLHAVVAQRLVRVICPSCKKPAAVNSAALKSAGISEKQCPADAVYESAGCDNCSSTGYRGREAVYEVAVVDSELKEMIARRASLSEMRRWAADKGINTMRRNAIRKLALGITTLEEVVKNTPPDSNKEA
ncbi:MAG: type II secretion system protein GspE [Candidatus Mycalebacterium zealandia]|nr:MAG: type II secretion system protein GspE [Candidatus Mycalebacterium zealandia]